MSKKIIALLLCVVMALSIAACGTTTPTDDGGDDAQKTYAIVPKSAGNPYNEK